MTDFSSTDPQPAAPTPRTGFHWPSFLMVILSGLSLLGFLGGAAMMLISGIVALFDPFSEPYTAATLFSYTLSGLAISLLLIPAIVFNIQRFSNKEPITSRLLSARLDSFRTWQAVVLFLAFVGIGSLMLPVEAVSWLVMPLANVGALALPVLIIIQLSTRNLDRGALHRNWSVFTAGMVFSPALIFAIEIIGLLVAFILLFAVAANWFPQISNFMMSILPLLENAITDPAQLEILINKLMSTPGVVIGLLFFLSVFVPIVEELLKPAAIWLLSRRSLTEQDGWILGLLSGAGFALVENLGNVSISEGWGFVALARFGATALHMFNTGIIGYTFVLARKEKRYRRLTLVILGTFVLHGIWNALAIFATVRTIDSGNGWTPLFVSLLALITAAMVYGLMAVNKKLQSAAEALPEPTEIESEI